jgi:DNA polymerase III epsilon subunit-like protein
MKLLIFDTETTGLPKTRKSFEEGPDNWPHIVSISWVIYDVDHDCIEKQRRYIIQPMGWEIPEVVVKIHGISEIKARIQGHPLKDVMVEFMSENFDVLVAHNLEFDYNVICSAIKYDLDMPFNGFRKIKICTMELSRDICKLKGMFGKNKSPKLSELYEYTFKRQPIPSALHDSLYDTLILTEIIQNCQELRLKMNLPNTLIDDKKDEVAKDGSKVLFLNLSS